MKVQQLEVVDNCSAAAASLWQSHSLQLKSVATECHSDCPRTVGRLTACLRLLVTVYRVNVVSCSFEPTRLGNPPTRVESTFHPGPMEPLRMEKSLHRLGKSTLLSLKLCRLNACPLIHEPWTSPPLARRILHHHPAGYVFLDIVVPLATLAFVTSPQLWHKRRGRTEPCTEVSLREILSGKVTVLPPRPSLSCEL